MEVFGNEVTYTLEKNTSYRVAISDHSRVPVKTSVQQIVSDSRGKLVIDITPIFDNPHMSHYNVNVEVEVREGTLLTSPVVLIDGVSKVRPYATVDEILAYMQGKVNPQQALEYERLARYMINSIVGFGFGQERTLVSTIGNNTDTLLFDERIGRVFAVYENGIKIWDTLDTSVTYCRGYSPYSMIVIGEPDNTVNHTPTWPTRYSIPTFHYEYDYLVDAEWGWPVVPQDIKEATLIMINDIVCGTNRYANKYIRQWNAGGVAMGYANQVFVGSGNLLVDNILEKYKMEAIRARML
jgi:hypothetical protein